MGWPDGLVPADPALVAPNLVPEKPTYFPMHIESTCPACDAVVITHGITQYDISICMGCRALLVFEANISLVYVTQLGIYSWLVMNDGHLLRRMTDAEEADALKNPQVQAAIAEVAEHHRRHGSPHPNISPPDQG